MHPTPTNTALQLKRTTHTHTHTHARARARARTELAFLGKMWLCFYTTPLTLALRVKHIQIRNPKIRPGG